MEEVSGRKIGKGVMGDVFKVIPKLDLPWLFLLNTMDI